MEGARTIFLLVRHGQTDWNNEGRIQGHQDIELNADGRKQASLLRESLAGESFDQVFSSDLSRALQTIGPLMGDLDVNLQTDVRLREWNLGECEGMTYAEAKSRYPRAVQKTGDFDPHFTAPGGESFFAFQTRVLSFFHEVAIKYCGERILVMTHGGTINLLLRHVLGVELTSSRHFVVENTGQSLVEGVPDHDTIRWRLVKTCAVPIEH